MMVRSIFVARLQIGLLIAAFCVVGLLLLWLRPGKQAASSEEPVKIHTMTIHAPADQNQTPAELLPNSHKVATVPVRPQSTDQAPNSGAAPPGLHNAPDAPVDPNAHVVQTLHPPASPIGPPPTGFTYAPQGWEHFQR